VGKDARGEFKVAESAATGRRWTMQQFYAKVIAHMVQWGAALYETAMRLRA
jgi:hypothetical protein